jgi:hypothetical protein
MLFFGQTARRKNMCRLNQPGLRQLKSKYCTVHFQSGLQIRRLSEVRDLRTCEKVSVADFKLVLMFPNALC